MTRIREEEDYTILELHARNDDDARPKVWEVCFTQWLQLLMSSMLLKSDTCAYNLFVTP